MFPVARRSVDTQIWATLRSNIVRFTYSLVSKTSMQVSIRLMPSEPHKPVFEEREGTFKERNVRSASFISSPIRIPRNSNTSRGTRVGCKAAKEKSAALRPEGKTEASRPPKLCEDSQ